MCDRADCTIQKFIMSFRPRKKNTAVAMIGPPVCKMFDVELKCPICHETISDTNDMWVTPCGHTFCRSCLIRLMNYNEELYQPTNCPKCRQKWPVYDQKRLRGEKVCIATTRLMDMEGTKENLHAVVSEEPWEGVQWNIGRKIHSGTCTLRVWNSDNSLSLFGQEFLHAVCWMDDKKREITLNRTHANIFEASDPEFGYGGNITLAFY